jgi:hypothetical protein
MVRGMVKMKLIRHRGIGLGVLMALVVLGGLCIVCGVASAVSFTDMVGEKDLVCYDIDVETVIDPLEASISWESDTNDIDLYLMDPQGDTIDSSDGYYNTESVYSDIRTPGLYALIIFPFDVTGVTTVSGDCNYPITKTTVEFARTIKQGQDITYEITVSKPNKPLLIRVQWDQSVDSLNVKVFDPSGDLMTPDPDVSSETDTSFLEWYDLEQAGKYKVKINGGVVDSSSKIPFTATSSYPIKLKSSGEDGDDDGGGLGNMTIPLLIIVIVIILGIVLAAAFMRKKPKEDEAPEAPPGMPYTSSTMPGEPAAPAPVAAPYTPPTPTTPSMPTTPSEPTVPRSPEAPSTPPAPEPSAGPVTPFSQPTPTTPPPTTAPTPPPAPTAPETPPEPPKPETPPEPSPPTPPPTPTPPTTPPMPTTPSAPPPPTPPPSPTTPSAPAAPTPPSTPPTPSAPPAATPPSTPEPPSAPTPPTTPPAPSTPTPPPAPTTPSVPATTAPPVAPAAPAAPAAPPASIKCKNCGAELKPTAKFCAMCGTAQ